MENIIENSIGAITQPCLVPYDTVNASDYVPLSCTLAKDLIKSMLKSCSIPLNTWEATTTNGPLWRHTCHTGLQDFEQKRLQIIKDRRTQRKNGQLPHGSATTYDYTICGRQCTVTRESTTDSGRDPSFDDSLHIYISLQISH